MSHSSFTFRYGVLDYSIPENSLLSSYSDEERWFIYGPITRFDNRQYQSLTTYHWFDNWNNLWVRTVSSEYPLLGLTLSKECTGFSTPMSDQCIEHITSKQWIIETDHSQRVQQVIHTYVTMFQEIETLKETIENLKHNHRLELEAAGQVLDSLVNDLFKKKEIDTSETDLLFFDTK